MSNEVDAGWPLEPWTVQLLGDVRRRGYTPGAWMLLLGSAWRRTQDTARRETALVHAWQRLALALVTAAALPVALAWRRQGPRRACRMGCVLMAGIAWQQADTYLHLGLHRRLDDGVLLPDLGMALWLTSLRGAAASYLLATTVVGPDRRGLALCAVAVGALTDALDGPVARRQRHATKLGAYADGEADVMLAVALTMAAVRRGTLPVTAAWWLLGARYVLPVSMACSVAFIHGRSPRLSHTLAGQLCGVAQAGLMACALAPHSWQRAAYGPRRLLLPLTAVLAVTSGVLQVRRMVRSR